MHRTVKRILLITAAFALFVVPAAAIAAAGFTDVADDNVFVADIQWMKDNDITRGCNPPTNDRFCPSSNVTREQMAAFMHRLAVNQVVDAATAIEAENAATADTASDADTLDGLDSTDLLGIAASGVHNVSTVTPFFAPLISITGFEVPANGGALLVDASAFFSRGSADQVGTVWIEVDVPGSCDMGSSGPGYGVYTVLPWPHSIDDLSITGAVEVAAGTHRIDLCHEGATPADVTATARLNVQWVPVVDVTGIASGETVTPSEVLAELVEQAGL